MKELFYLLAGVGDAKAAVTLGQGLPEKVNGLPCFYYWRQSIRDGEYAAKGWTLSVNADRRRQWEQMFRQMRGNGVEVPVVTDHTVKAENLKGYVVDVRQSGPWLEELHQYLGEEARDLALRNKVSVGIDPRFKDGHGHLYGEAIAHSALVPDPVVPGQGEATPLLAASRGQQGEAEIYCLAASDDGGSNMELLKQLAALLGVAAFATDAEAVAAVKGLKEKLGTTETQLQASLTEKQGLETKVQELSRSSGKPPELSAEAIDALLEADQAGLDALLANGAIDANVHKNLGGLLKGTDGKPVQFMLSRTASGTPERISKLIIAALKGNKPVSLGHATGQQGLMDLSRSTPDGRGGTGGGAAPTQEQVQAQVRDRLLAVGAAPAK